MAFTRSLSAAMLRGSLIALFVLTLIVTARLNAQRLPPLPLQVRYPGSYLGLRLVDIDDERAKTLKLDELSGVEITNVEEGAPADRAGVKPGDVVLSFNGEKVLGVQQFVRLVGETPPGRRVILVCLRTNTRKEFGVTTIAPRGSFPQQDIDFDTMRITDVPSPLMLWRNLVLGLDSESLSEQLSQAFGVKQGILVWSVTPTYPAQRAGLRAGDVLTRFCGHSIQSPRELGVLMQQPQNAQKELTVELVRDHKVVYLSIPLNNGR